MHTGRYLATVIAALLMTPAMAGCDDGKKTDQDTAVDTAVDTEMDTADDGTDVPADVTQEDADLDATDVMDAMDAEDDVPPDAPLEFAWDAPELPDRYGFFQVQQVSSTTGAISFAGGDFGDYSAVEPERPLWTDGTCTVTFYEADPPDPTGLARLSAGTPITIAGGGGSHGTITCTYDDTLGYACDLPATPGTTIFTEGGGDTLTFDAPGDDVVAFNFDQVAPPPAVNTGDLVISKATGYTVSWEEVDAEGMVIALVVGDYGASLEGGISIQCIVDLTDDPARTSFEMPDVALGLLENTGMVGGLFYVGLLQLMALNTYNETLSDDTVMEVMVMNGAASQVTVTD